MISDTLLDAIDAIDEVKSREPEGGWDWPEIEKIKTLMSALATYICQPPNNHPAVAALAEEIRSAISNLDISKVEKAHAKFLAFAGEMRKPADS